MKTIHLDPANLPREAERLFKRAFAGYRGKRFKIRGVNHPINLRSSWSGGSRDLFVVLSEDASIKIPNQSAFDPAVAGADSFTIPHGMAVVQHTTFQGKDLGLTLIIPVDRLTALIPAPKHDLTADQLIILQVVGTYKSYARRDEAAHQGIGDSRYNILIDELKALGLLRKNGSITPEGRNY